MWPLVASCVRSAFIALNPLVPSPVDTDEWGLRVLRLSGPIFINESIESKRFSIGLVNYAASGRSHIGLDSAIVSRLVRLEYTGPNGETVRSPYRSKTAPLPNPKSVTTPARGCAMIETEFRHFEHWRVFRTPGTYHVRATLKVGDKVLRSPAVPIEVLELRDRDTIASHLLALEGAEAAKRPEDQIAPRVQQVRVGAHTFLVYQHYAPLVAGSRSTWLIRLGELPGKVEMVVAGAYGAGNPLTISYTDAAAPGGTRTLFVDSGDGKVLTAQEAETLRAARKGK